MSSASASASSIQFSSACFHALEVSFKEESVGVAVGFVAFFRRACFVLLIMVMLFLQHLHTVLLPKGCNCESKLCEWIFAAQ